jgi:hypothetical protein
MSFASTSQFRPNLAYQSLEVIGAFQSPLAHTTQAVALNPAIPWVPINSVYTPTEELLLHHPREYTRPIPGINPMPIGATNRWF